MQDTIFINKLKFETIIGILPFEREVKQTIIVDLSLNFDTTKAIDGDDIKHTIDYSKLVDDLENFCEQTKFNLIETLADAMASFILKKYPVKLIQLKLTKPGAIKQTQDLGVSIERTRDI